MKFIPSGNRVLIKPEEDAKKLAGGIIIPDIARGKAPNLTLTGAVVAVGTGKRREDGIIYPCEYTLGQTVYFSPYEGHKVEIERVEHWVIDADSILGVLTN